jgi:hypothetical protein
MGEWHLQLSRDEQVNHRIERRGEERRGEEKVK